MAPGRCQAAAVEISNELNASGASLLRLPRVLQRLRDDFEQHRVSLRPRRYASNRFHRSRTVAMS